MKTSTCRFQSCRLLLPPRGRWLCTAYTEEPVVCSFHSHRAKRVAAASHRLTYHVLGTAVNFNQVGIHVCSRKRLQLSLVAIVNKLESGVRIGLGRKMQAILL